MSGREQRLVWELQKVSREIATHGLGYVVYAEEKDKRGEATGEIKEKSLVRGLFHTTKDYVSVKDSVATETRTKGSPMLLITFEDAKEIENSDFFVINKQRFNIISKNNIQEYGILCDLSLEVVLDGNN